MSLPIRTNPRGHQAQAGETVLVWKCGPGRATIDPRGWLEGERLRAADLAATGNPGMLTEAAIEHGAAAGRMLADLDQVERRAVHQQDLEDAVRGLIVAVEDDTYRQPTDLVVGLGIVAQLQGVEVDASRHGLRLRCDDETEDDTILAAPSGSYGRAKMVFIPPADLDRRQREVYAALRQNGLGPAEAEEAARRL